RGSGPSFQHLSAHLEVLGVHVQLLAVQLAQLGEGVLDAVQVLDGLPEGGQHLLPVGLDLGVRMGRGSPRGPHPPARPPRPELLLPEGGPADFGHVHLAPKAGDQLLLFGRPVHHAGCRRRERSEGYWRERGS
uniref:Uncharacterized protein n=1 Tax=Pseudonaja textilis TaxID=8673 RepID=A0A670YY37_PSETE